MRQLTHTSLSTWLGLPIFFFKQQLYFPGTLLQSTTLSLYVQFGNWNCQSKDLLLVVSSLGGAPSQKQKIVIIIQVESQNSKKFCSSSSGRRSPISLSWPRQLQRGNLPGLPQEPPFVLHLACYQQATCGSKACLTEPPLRAIPLALGLPIPAPTLSEPISSAMRNKCTLEGDEDLLPDKTLLSFPWILLKLGLNFILLYSCLHCPPAAGVLLSHLNRNPPSSATSQVMSEHPDLPSRRIQSCLV